MPLLELLPPTPTSRPALETSTCPSLDAYAVLGRTRLQDYDLLRLGIVNMPSVLTSLRVDVLDDYAERVFEGGPGRIGVAQAVADHRERDGRTSVD